MPSTEVSDQVEDRKQCRLRFDDHYTVGELEWNRIVGPSGLAVRLVEAMAGLSTGVFNFESGERIPDSRAERLEVIVEGTSHTIRFEYDGSYTSTALEGVRHLFGEVNGALRREGLDYRYVLERAPSAGASAGYRLLLARRSALTEESRGREIVAGLEIRDYELG